MLWIALVLVVALEGVGTAVEEHILDALGFTELVRIDNRKHTFTTDEYEVVLEDVKDLGVFLEVEAKLPCCITL